MTLIKLSRRQLREDVMARNMDAMLKTVNNKSRAVRGWTIEREEKTWGEWRTTTCWWRKFNLPSTDDYDYRYEMYMIVRFKRNDDQTPQVNELDSILKLISTAVNQPTTGKWSLSLVDEEEFNPPEAGDMNLSVDDLEYVHVEMPKDEQWEKAYDHLYGLDPHIQRVRRALELGQLSSWAIRSHVALIGPPGCGKSDICRSLKSMLGEEAVMEFDATNMTQAGAVKELLEREILPRAVVIEEIEKANEAALMFLLAILDMRSEIRKVTARANIQRDMKLFAVATVNNLDKFKTMAAGALASRFSNKVYFKPPDRNTLSMILHREVTKIAGDYSWIDPTLDYCEEQGVSDPREVISICLTGRDMLLTGEWQDILRATGEETGAIETAWDQMDLPEIPGLNA